MNPDNPRASKLNKHLNSVIHGRTTLSPKNNVLFLEAICASPDPVTCINNLAASKDGLTCLQNSMRFDLSLTFLNGPATSLLNYLTAPILKDISGGKLLQQIVIAIVEPPIFWDAFHKAFHAKQLQNDAQFCFAWLLYRLIFVEGPSSNRYREVAQDRAILDAILLSESLEVRTIGCKIQQIVEALMRGSSTDIEDSAGGRHDNDHANFRKIAILPTTDELHSAEIPFLPLMSQLDTFTRETRLATYLDAQFRLLREDMLYEMRDDLQVTLRRKKGQNRGFVVQGVTVQDIPYSEKNGNNCNWGIRLQLPSDLPQLMDVSPAGREIYLKKHREIFPHQSMVCVIIDDKATAFLALNRDETLLAAKPPVIVLQPEGRQSTATTLLRLHTAKEIKISQIYTPIFSYEPILKGLQEKTGLPFLEELLFWSEGDVEGPLLKWPRDVVESIKANPLQDFRALLRTPRSITLDKDQADALLRGLTQRVSLIQGPPGTGKSFIGALLAKVLHDTSQKILVVCYTNHALDQFLVELLNIGIPQESIVRLGGKATARTEPLSFHRLPKNFRRRQADHMRINMLKDESRDLSVRLESTFKRYNVRKNPVSVVMSHLEFEHGDYFATLSVPRSVDGMQQVGKKGKGVGPHYLIGRWISGFDAGVLKSSPQVQAAPEIWNMDARSRKCHYKRWMEDILKENVEDLCDIADNYNESLRKLNREWTDNDAETLSTKQIIGCTTTGAAKYREALQRANRNVLLVEEAGEILESHILTALGGDMTQLILIGDHKQLRPKVNNYKLTVEKGEGYDLNRSLFERLILKGYPHTTLSKQHRMRPEVSTLVRHLTYPGLTDAARTQNRPDLRGVQDNVVFISHDKPEDEYSQLKERRDQDVKSSKQNKFEVDMILKIVRYLAQQGYGTDNMVVLTPYLGQLRALQEALKKDHDPVLDDLDSFDLVRAGLISPAAAKVTKKGLRLATIDNYQGEESDIVIASLTRSNANNDVGFMCAPERLNVLLSRARIALIILGNAHTFRNARKGKEVWTRLFELLKQNGHIYEGLPVQCERHRDRRALLKCAGDFDTECPDGGCTNPCNATLKCGLHPCPSKCHQISDHSKMPCEFPMISNCLKGHRQQWKCFLGRPASCHRCDAEQKLAEEKRQKEFALQQKREAEERMHAHKLAELDKKIARQREALRDGQLANDRQRAIRQREQDLKNAVALAAQPLPVGPALAAPASTVVTSQTHMDHVTTTLGSSQPHVHVEQSKPSVVEESAAREKWQHEKEVNGETNDAIDKIMEMTGLEEVKEQVLRIKDKMDTSKRQNSSIANERFNVAMLGNPGTGKTTVARHYGNFLVSVGVIPGDQFIETTGSRLSSDGVSGIKKQLDELVNAGGGTMFIDEAYQMTSEHNVYGRQVLDFLLAEMENQTGKIVFIFAGYNQEMEKFLEHNPGFTSRIPYTLKFKDYTDEELSGMLENLVRKQFEGKMKVERGIQGLYGRIAVRRLGRGRSGKGFGNARALANLFAKIRERQAERLSAERRKGLQPDDFVLTKEDLIGPKPSQVMIDSDAWRKLQGMVGLAAVKQTVHSLFCSVDINYERELLEKKPQEISLNRVLIGNPGTGKTTVAKLYGQILADLGLISNGEVVIKNPADFIGSALGQSEQQTKAILASTIGKVLVIDEAYMLYGGAGSNNVPDPYKTAVIDTIVAEVQGVPGEDRCVLLLGYKQQIEDMFQNVNPGLARRFAVENAFHFHDYNDSELMAALELKLKAQDLTATDGAKTVAIEILSRARNRPHFGNIGEIENLLGQAKLRWQARLSALPMQQRRPDKPFEPQDFDPDYDRSQEASTNLAKLFEDVVGCEEIVRKLDKWQQMARNMKTRGKDPRQFIPTNFVFKGPPGTGKTSTARKMGRVYYDMGFLSSTEVVESSASDLVGQYIGHTGPKTRKVFERALGRVLFIDEAYRLNQGSFAKEAMDELVGILTDENFRAKLIVILAGYDREMNDLMTVNTGLSSRFPEELIFPDMSSKQCLEILRRKLMKESIVLEALDDHSSTAYCHMENLLHQLVQLPSWGNARDMETLSKQMVTIVFTTAPCNLESNDPTQLTLTNDEAVSCIESMLSERRARANNLPRPIVNELQRMFPGSQGAPAPPLNGIRQGASSPPVHAKKTEGTTRPPVSRNVEQDSSQHSHATRDANVADEIWHQLQLDQRVTDDAERLSHQAAKQYEQEIRDAEEREEAARKEAEGLAEQEDFMRIREQARLRELAAREARVKAEAALEMERRKQREEARVQAKLREMGVCVAGYRWIKQPLGYRCAGGSHFIDNAILGI